jgi:manganese/zinc/iron transport system substrate-binding protein
MIADAARRVGGDRVEVRALMGPGVDPHLYKASERDVTRMAEADLILYNGLHLEGAMAEVLERLEEKGLTAAVTADIPRDRLLAPPEFKGQYDPHVWFDVGMWRQVVLTIGERLVVLDTMHAATYRANAADYADELDRLEAEVRAAAGRLAPEQRVLVTAHDAFNYFGRAYGFQVRGLQGISTASEAGLGDVQALAEFIAARRIPAMFVESSVSPRTIEAVQAAVRSRGFEVTIGGQLFSDAMGSPGTPEGTYPGMIRHNIRTITRALDQEPLP